VTGEIFVASKGAHLVTGPANRVIGTDEVTGVGDGLVCRLILAVALLRSGAVTSSQRCTLDVFLLLTRHDQVLLALRQGTGFADGQWNLPSGKAEAGESAVAAVIREAREETGIRLSADELSFVATVHCRNSDTDTRVGLFFQAAAAESAQGVPHNAEPHKCGGIAWYPMAMLPEATVPYNALGISLYLRKDCFGSIGW
jgi:8-oxo-dGTP diphosphatase